MAVSDVKGSVPLSTTFTLRLNTTPSCSLVNYPLNFGDNITTVIQVPLTKCTKPYSVTLYHLYQFAGVYTATLSHDLGPGKTNTRVAQATITVTNPPVITGTTKYGTLATAPTSGSVPLKVTFSLSATDSSESAGIYYQIAFGDGQTGTFPRTSTPSLSHVYSAQGEYAAAVSRRTGCSLGVCNGPSSPVATVIIGAN